MVRQRLRQCYFFLMQVMGSMATNGSVHTYICVSDIYCDTDFNADVIFDALADAPCERGFSY